EPRAAVRVPFITWGGDLPTIVANGGLATRAGSIYKELGLSLELSKQDDFVKQVEDYLAGRSPYLRGTAGMIHCAAEALSKDRRTQPVVILQLTWSTGGDCLVVRPGLNRIGDLKGKPIALQQYSPHIGYMDVLLRDA